MYKHQNKLINQLTNTRPDKDYENYQDMGTKNHNQSFDRIKHNNLE